MTDTVGAEPVQALRIEVRGPDGKPAPRTPVRVDPVLYDDSRTGGRAAEVFPAELGAAGYGWPVTDTSDAKGIVHVQVKLGSKTGPGRLVVTAPILGMQDTARFMIQPGAAVAVQSLPADTAVHIGARMTLRTAVLDRFGNRRDDVVAYTVSGSGASVSGGIVSGDSFGRVMVVVAAAGRSDTSQVSVVPPGTIAAYSAATHSGDSPSIYTLNLDGSDFRELRRSAATGFRQMPVGWLGGTRLVYEEEDEWPGRHLYVYDLETRSSQRFLRSEDRMERETLPRVSHNGSWVYFNGGDYNSVRLYRARPDGTGKEPVGSVGGVPSTWVAAPSPDATQVAYVRDGEYQAGDILVMSHATLQVRNLGIRGMMPRWSPDGAQIAYIAGSGQNSSRSGVLSVVKPDGTGARAVTSSRTEFFGGLDWSPDGKYIVGVTANGETLTVVEVATGNEVPISLPRTLSSPMWKP